MPTIKNIPFPHMKTRIRKPINDQLAKIRIARLGGKVAPMPYIDTEWRPPNIPPNPPKVDTRWRPPNGKDIKKYNPNLQRRPL